MYPSYLLRAFRIPMSSNFGPSDPPNCAWHAQRRSSVLPEDVRTGSEVTLLNLLSSDTVMYGNAHPPRSQIGEVRYYQLVPGVERDIQSSGAGFASTNAVRSGWTLLSTLRGESGVRKLALQAASAYRLLA